jgi:hypothetical protein
MTKYRNIFTSFFAVLIVAVIVISSQSGCSDSPIGSNNPLFGGGTFDPTEAKITMTLASLSYVNENNSAFMRDSLIIQLAMPNYSTRGNWKLAWGPGLSTDNANMMYIAVDSSGSVPAYCLAIRGTDWCFISNIIQDLFVWNQLQYPYGTASDSVKVAQGSLGGLDTLLQLTDPITGLTAQQFINSLPSNGASFYITGHSLGGALATIYTSWFLDAGFGSKFKVKSYTYAAPSVGNEGYRLYFDNLISMHNAESHRLINSRDVIPRFCANLQAIINEQIPTTLPPIVEAAIITTQVYFSDTIVYKNVASTQDIGTYIPTNCPGSAGDLNNYECWVGFEHDHNNYLRLLNADTTSFFYADCESKGWD